MPRVMSFRVGPLWVAFVVDDYGEPGTRYWAWTEQRARDRAASAV